MSAFVVGKIHIDLMVRAAIEYGRPKGQPGSPRFQWWVPGDDESSSDRRYLDEYADGSDEQRVSPSQVGQLLVDENVRSVAYRYDDTDPGVGDLPGPTDAYYLGPYVYADPGYVLSPGEVFKAIDCFEYQSCETSDWRSSEAFAFCSALREAFCTLVADYEDAPWAFDDVPARAS